MVPLPLDIAAREEPGPRATGPARSGVPQMRELYDPAMFPPPEGTEFVLVNAGTSVALGATVELATYTLPQGMDGVLRFVCFSEMAPDDDTGFSILVDGNPTAWRNVFAPPAPTNTAKQADAAMCLRLKGGQTVSIVGVNNRGGGGAAFTATLFAYGYVWPESLTRIYREGA
jgi:hypothetical protein